MADPNQVRINELARELEIKAKVLIDYLPSVGVTEKKTHSSSIDNSHAEAVRKHFLGLANAEAQAEAEKEKAAKAAKDAARRPATPPAAPCGEPPRWIFARFAATSFASRSTCSSAAPRWRRARSRSAECESTGA